MAKNPMVIRIDDRKVRAMLKAAPGRYQEVLKTTIKKVGYLTENVMRGEAPESGISGGRSLSSRISTKISNGGMSALVGSTAPYAVYVEKGTRPHFPPASAGTPLDRWARSKGIPTWAVALSISRKGTKANPYTKRTFGKVKPQVSGIFNSEAIKATRKNN